MLGPVRLIIRLVPGRVCPRAGQVEIDLIQGGPDDLLHWLETQLGLPSVSEHRAARVLQYAAALEQVEDSCFCKSLQADRWATASELLARRDALLIAGWDEVEADGLPRMVNDMARAADGYAASFLGVGERLNRVNDALEAGQILPPHECQLYETIDRWPNLWQQILSRMTVVSAESPEPTASPGTALFQAGEIVLGNSYETIQFDQSFRFAQARSQTAAVDFVAAVLAASPETIASTVVHCEDDALAVRLDARLGRLGLPTMGAALTTQAHPVLQVLPLALELCWDPVDPQSLLDFLTLPVLPFPRAAASSLARALSLQPGLGSAEWDKAFDELCEESDQTDGKLKQRLHDWLLCERSAQGQPIGARLIAAQCRKVSQWASGRASLIANDENRSDADEQLMVALFEASQQSSLLGELVELQGDEITEPQLLRLVEEVTSNGVVSKPCLEADGGPQRVRSLSELSWACDRLIWLGIETADALACPWSVSQLEQLAAAGVSLDDGSAQITSLRAAESRGFCQARDSFLAVLLPQDSEQRPHPIWLTIANKFPSNVEPVAVEELFESGHETQLEPFIFSTRVFEIQPPQPERSEWDIPSGLLTDRKTVSASELQDRLACPLKWTLNYQAKLRPSEIASLPDDFQLRGNFFHSVLERVFGGGGELPSVTDSVDQVATAFDHRLPRDAAPLAQPERRADRDRLRSELIFATRKLIETLALGGYQILGIEEELSGTAFGKPLRGWIDCVVVRDDGEEGVIDFKYGGRSKYYTMIREGEAVQLATYAYDRSLVTGRFPAAAYLILSDGLLYTPTGSPIQGIENQETLDGPSIESVWSRFASAVQSADEWLTSDNPVPARPLQNPAQWPTDATLVLTEKLPRGNSQSVCRYCAFTRICGIEVTS